MAKVKAQMEADVEAEIANDSEREIEIEESKDEQDDQYAEAIKVASIGSVNAMKEDAEKAFNFISNILYTPDVRKDPNMAELRQFAVKDLLTAKHFISVLLDIEGKYAELHDAKETKSDNNEGKNYSLDIKDGVGVTEKTS